MLFHLAKSAVISVAADPLGEKRHRSTVIWLGAATCGSIAAAALWFSAVRDSSDFAVRAALAGAMTAVALGMWTLVIITRSSASKTNSLRTEDE
jgi:hypothetical protein